MQIFRLNGHRDAVEAPEDLLGLRMPPRASRDKFKLAVTNDLASIEQIYREFEQKAECTPFQTFDWLATWQRCIGLKTATTPVIVTVARDDGELLFLLPLAIEKTFAGRRLVFLGRALNDYNGPLIACDLSALGQDEFMRLWRLVLDLLRAVPGLSFDYVMFDKMPEKIGNQANPLLALATRPNPSGAYLTFLKGDWDHYYAAKRSGHRRRRDRSRRNKLAELGAINFVVAGERDSVELTLTRLFAQKSRQLRAMGARDLFADPTYLDFFKSVSTQLPGFVVVSRLEVGSACAAATFGLLFRGCFHQIIVSYDGEFSRFGPGTVQLHEMFRYAIQQNATVYDFTIGDEPFKLEWADEKRVLYDHFAAASWLGRATVARLALVSRLKQRIKSSPALLSTAFWLRELAGKFKPGSAMHPDDEA